MRLFTLPSKEDQNPVSKKRRHGANDVFLNQWDGLRALLDVARSESLSEAAARLGLQQSTLSRRIKALEDAIGRKLVKRSPRGVELTADGGELVNVLERFDEDLNVAGRWIARGVRGAERPIFVNIACTEGLSAYWLTQFLPALRKRNVQACYNIYASLSVQPEKGKTFQASVQMHQPLNAESARQIGNVHFSAMASREYVEEMGVYRPGDHPADHRWIEYAPFRVMNGSLEAWFQRRKVEVAPFTVTNSLVMTVNAVREGAGIGLLPSYMPISMPELVPLDVGLHLKFPIWQHVDPKSVDTPELNAALGLIRAAIDPDSMPWFGDKPVSSPDFDEWRHIRDQAIRRLR